MLSNFYWILKDEIAGMAMPTASRSSSFFANPSQALQAAIQDEIMELKRHGVCAIVTLTETPLHSQPFIDAGLSYLHLPVNDMTAPTLEQIKTFIAFAKENIANKKPVVIHCLGGSGRTGTMLACYLVSKGVKAYDAIKTVRQIRPSAIETMTQEAVIIEYAMEVSKEQE